MKIQSTFELEVGDKFTTRRSLSANEKVTIIFTCEVVIKQDDGFYGIHITEAVNETTGEKVEVV